MGRRYDAPAEGMKIHLGVTLLHTPVQFNRFQFLDVYNIQFFTRCIDYIIFCGASLSKVTKAIRAFHSQSLLH